MSAAPALTPAPDLAADETAPPVGLYAKLAEVILEVEEVAKDGSNQHFNYRFTSAEAMLKALRAPLAERRIVLMPSRDRIEDRDYQTSKGKASVITTVHMDFTFVDGDTGEMYKCSWSGRGDDNADKGLSKAYTNAIKTFLREVFLIPQGDDDEGGRRFAPAPAEPDILSPEEYEELVEAFKVAGAPLAPLALHLDCEATQDAVTARASRITSAQAREAIKFLQGLGTPA